MIVGVSTIGIIKGIGTAQDRHSAAKSNKTDASRKALVFFLILVSPLAFLACGRGCVFLTCLFHVRSQVVVERCRASVQ